MSRRCVIATRRAECRRAFGSTCTHRGGASGIIAGQAALSLRSTAGRSPWLLVNGSRGGVTGLQRLKNTRHRVALFVMNDGDPGLGADGVGGAPVAGRGDHGGAGWVDREVASLPGA